MGRIFDAAASRGYASYASFTSRRTFSFADYLNPRRMGFGVLRVLNEETLAPGQGVPLHPHENMEIISIPLSGLLRHQDSRGASHIIAPGDIHILSAGLGVTHWEYNHSTSEPAHYLQAWIKPKSRGTPARYGHGTIDEASMAGRFSLVAAPAGGNGAVEINQDAWISLARLEPGASLHYEKYLGDNGLYLFLIEGRLQTGTEVLASGDGLGLTDALIADFLAQEPSTLLCMEVPMLEHANLE